MGLWLGLVTIHKEPRFWVGLGNASALALIAVGLSAWDPFELWSEMRSTGEKADELQWIADWLKSAGTPPPPLSQFNLVKLLRWLAMNWVWTALFVGFGGCTRACFASTSPFDLLKPVGLMAVWVLFVAGMQQLPKGAADMLEIRLRGNIESAADQKAAVAAMAKAEMLLGGFAMLAGLVWWTWHLYAHTP